MFCIDFHNIHIKVFPERQAYDFIFWTPVFGQNVPKKGTLKNFDLILEFLFGATSSGVTKRLLKHQSGSNIFPTHSDFVRILRKIVLRINSSWINLILNLQKIWTYFTIVWLQPHQKRRKPKNLTLLVSIVLSRSHAHFAPVSRTKIITK